MRVILEIKGKIPSFKNNKMVIAKSPQGKPLERPLLITKPEYQKAMEEIVRSFVFQLQSVLPTGAERIWTANSLRSAIASWLPADDCWTALPEIAIKGVRCDPGGEGATVIIEKI